MYKHERSLVKDYSGRPFVLLGVNNDTKISRVKTAIKENDLNWRSWYDGKGGPIVRSYGISSFPTIFLIDHTGEIRHKNLRGSKLDAALEALVEEAEADGMSGGSEPTPQLREFVDSTGKYKVTAKLVGFESGSAVLETDSGEEKKVPWSRLSLEDQRFVANFRLVEMGLDRIAKQKLNFSFDNPIRFSDISGKYSIEGTYITINKGDAVIWNADGKEIRVKWKLLSEDTKDLIKQDTKARKSHP